MRFRLTALTVGLTVALTAFAQSEQPCVVMQYNQKEQKTPLSGVEVMVTNAGSTVSDNEGKLTLVFRSLKPGDKVNLVSAKKTGFEIFNSEAVEQWVISRNRTPLSLVLVRKDYFDQLKARLTQSSQDNYRKKYEQAKSEVEKARQQGKLNEQDYYQRLDELEAHYDNQLKNLDKYVDRFARFDLSELSAQEQQFLELAHAGRLDEAAAAYDRLDAAGKYKKAVDNIRQLNEDIGKLDAERQQQQAAAQSLYAMLKRQVATLELAGGEDNFRKAGELLKRAALADTTNIDAVFEYANFAYQQLDYGEAETFYLMVQDTPTDSFTEKQESYDPYQESLQLNMGALYLARNDYPKAEDYLLKALEGWSRLFTWSPDGSRPYLAAVQLNLGSLYYALQNYSRAEAYFLQALENKTVLFQKDPDIYRTELATVQNALGDLYRDHHDTGLHDDAKAEEYILKALENVTVSFEQNPDVNRLLLTRTQMNLGELYSKNIDIDHHLVEELFLKARENSLHLFAQNPEAYRRVLANTQYCLGVYYTQYWRYDEAEENLLKALENRERLFARDPKAFGSDLAQCQVSLGDLYDRQMAFDKAEAYYSQAIAGVKKLLSDEDMEDVNGILSLSSALISMVVNMISSGNIDKAERINDAVLDSFEPLLQKPGMLYDTKALGFDLYLNKAEICLMTGKNDDAVSYFKNAFQLAPERVEPWMVEGIAGIANEYAVAKNYAKALETIDIALDLMPDEDGFKELKSTILSLQKSNSDNKNRFRIIADQ